MLKKLFDSAADQGEQGSAGGVVLRGRDVLLRAPRAADQEAWLAVRSQSRQFLEPWEPSWSEDATNPVGYRARLRYFLREWDGGSSFQFFVFRLIDDALVGGIALNNVRYGACLSASVGYWIGISYARRGYTAEALRLCLIFAFEKLGLNRVEAACMPSNKASAQLLLRAGFHFEGVARRYLQINGSFRDHMIFSCLRSDPPTGRSGVFNQQIHCVPS